MFYPEDSLLKFFEICLSPRCFSHLVLGMRCILPGVNSLLAHSVLSPPAPLTGSTRWGCRNILFPLQHRLKRCGGAAGTASPSGRSPSVYFPLQEAALPYRRACACAQLADHICQHQTALCVNSKGDVPVCVAWRKAVVSPEPPVT